MKVRPLISSLGVLVSACLLVGCAAGSTWETTLGVGACVQRAKLALRDSDFNQGLEIVGDKDNKMLTADHGSYQARLNCMLDQVRFVVVGPDYDQALWYRDTIIRKF
jgi:hypothetical protein